LETRGRKKIFINWAEYDRLKEEEHMLDRDIARIFSVNASTLCYKKKSRRK